MAKPPRNHKKIEQALSGTARAALLGISDGLVTNVSFILGVAGAGASTNIVRLTGLASLFAGAFSMAVGEYISMRGQIELLESVLADEKELLRQDPKSAHEALEAILTDDGVSSDTAHAAALDIGRDPSKAMAVYARGRLGVNPDELGSAWGSAFSSLIMFSAGAFVPLVPWFFTGGAVAVAYSLGLSVVAALGIGAYLGFTTTGLWLRPALRQLLVLVLASSATYLIGRLFHASVM